MRTLGELVEGRPVFALQQNLTVRQAAQQMASKRIGAVPVVEGERLVGIFSERDLVTRVVSPGLDPGTLSLGQVMTREVLIADPDETTAAALERMLRSRIRHLPVVSSSRLVGFVSFRDLVTHGAQGQAAAPKVIAADVQVSEETAHSADLTWECHGCGHAERSEVPPAACPGCGAPGEQFALVE